MRPSQYQQKQHYQQLQPLMQNSQRHANPAAIGSVEMPSIPTHNQQQHVQMSSIIRSGAIVGQQQQQSDLRAQEQQQPHHQQQQPQHHQNQPQTIQHQQPQRTSQMQQQAQQYMQQQHQIEQHLQQVQFHRTQIDKLSQRIYDALYQLIKIKFGHADNSSEKLHEKLAGLVQDKLTQLQDRAQKQRQQQQQQVQQTSQNHNAPDSTQAQRHLENIFPHQARGHNFGVDTTQLSEQEQVMLKDGIEAEMMQNDRQLESGLVNALLKIDAHKQSLLQIVALMREQAVINERRQKKFVELLLEHQKPGQDKNQKAGVGLAAAGADGKEPFELGMLFVVPTQLPSHSPMVQAQPVGFSASTHRQNSFFYPQQPGQYNAVGGGGGNSGGGGLPTNHDLQLARQQATEDWLNFGFK